MKPLEIPLRGYDNYNDYWASCICEHVENGSDMSFYNDFKFSDKIILLQFAIRENKLQVIDFVLSSVGIIKADVSLKERICMFQLMGDDFE